MGKINDGVRVVASGLNTFHGLIGLLFVGAAGYAIHATYRSVTSWLSYVLGLGLLLFITSLLGCAGMHRQIVRRGRCTGRCLLSFYQLAMVALLCLLVVSALSIRSLTNALGHIVDAPTTDVPYSRMERAALAPFFDQFYWKADEVYGQGQGGYGWFVGWVANNCPGSMSLIHCDPCPGVPAASYVPEACCPDRPLCAEGELDACPYKRCRKGVAIYLQAQLGLFQRYSHVFLALQVFVLINTCLLLCYNPRDSLADLLQKTGILVHHPTDDDDDYRLPQQFQPHSGGGGNNNRRSRRRSPRSATYSPRQDHGGDAVASPTNFHATPRTYPVYNNGGGGGGGGSQQQRPRSTPTPPAVAVAYPIAEHSPGHPHSVV